MVHDAEIEKLLKAHIRDIPDWPVPGVMFRDITTLLAVPSLVHTTVDALVAPYREADVDKIAAVESRGFIFGTPMAYVLNAGIVPVRKPNKLPYDTYSESYDLEYGSSRLEIHTDAIAPGDRVVVVDDLLATGGTLEAAIKLVQRFDAEIVGVTVVAELVDLNGRDKLGDVPFHSLIRY